MLTYAYGGKPPGLASASAISVSQAAATSVFLLQGLLSNAQHNVVLNRAGFLFYQPTRLLSPALILLSARSSAVLPMLFVGNPALCPFLSAEASQ